MRRRYGDKWLKRCSLLTHARSVWAPIGERPIAFGHHRYEWLYVTAFVAPASGETVWFLSNGIDKPFFAKLLEAFARATGAGRDRIIVLINRPFGPIEN
jgi:hypothetical protein